LKAAAIEPAGGLAVRGLTTVFPTPHGDAVAVDGIDLDVRPGEVVGLVGESGSGKSMTLRSIVRLVPEPGRIGGRVEWQGRDLMAMTDGELRQVRGAEIAMIFQEPMTALNPVLPIRLQIEESLQAHTSLDGPARRARALELMNIVGIPAAERRLDEFPHQFSGGMRQRVMIAIALASSPKLLLADEPTTALDVTIQDQILKLILDLRDRLGMSVLFVTHDLGVVAATCDRMMVMYAGRVVETGTVAEVFAAPHHPYTRGLLGSVPHAGAERRMLLSIEGTPPSLLSLPAGCPFHPRCAFAVERCRAERPQLDTLAAGREVACFRHLEVAAMTEAA
jgi:peptide/nickel transport system ATP-binding protein/oligopeptide transport system ATP-binding protein